MGDNSEWYYMRSRKPKVAHIWTGDDTRCRMASTNGMDNGRYQVVSARGPVPLCRNCVDSKREPQPVKLPKKAQLLSDLADMLQAAALHGEDYRVACLYLPLGHDRLNAHHVKHIKALLKVARLNLKARNEQLLSESELAELELVRDGGERL